MSHSDNKESLTPVESNNVKLDAAVVEQLVMAAVAAASQTEDPVKLPTTETTPIDSVATTTTTTTAATTPINDVVASPELINFTDAQLQQINAVQAQAIAQSIVNGTTDYQQLFANLNNNTTTTTINEKKPKDPITEKVRQENRERKKRWRQQNQDRNKDNDLRCRVNKRAIKLFGKEDSPHKRKWIEDEFEKRRSKRKEKEDRKLNSPTQQNTISNTAAVEGLHSLLTDPYISLLANNLNAFTHDVKDEKPEQFTSQLLEFLQQQQQQQSNDFNNTLVNQMLSQPPIEQHPNSTTIEQHSTIEQNSNPTTIDENPKVEDATTVENNEVKDEGTATIPEKSEEKEKGEKPDYPMDAVLTLMQLNAGWRQ